MGGTYQATFEDGSIAQGGYADYTTQRGRFAIPIPEGLESAIAAPLMCAGATVYSPLKRHGAGPGKKVGVVGIGGLGHLAIQFALALGAETYAFSQSDSKRADAEKLGLKSENFIIAKDAKATLAKWQRNFDLIICTNSGLLPLEELYFPLLRPEGVICLCGLPEEKLPAMFGQVIIGRSISLAGSLIAGSKEIKEMLQREWPAFDYTCPASLRSELTHLPLRACFPSRGREERQAVDRDAPDGDCRAGVPGLPGRQAPLPLRPRELSDRHKAGSSLRALSSRIFCET